MVRRRSAQAKVFRDNTVPGDYVKLSATAVAISDTPIFQRLRYLKQLGMAEFVFPGATHTRFFHSLGVAHRAKEFAQRLKSRQPELELSDADLLVLEIAGLCHDLGHGPFSHSFESELVPHLLPQGETWEHERMSCVLFDHICHTYHVDLSPDEQQRVKDLIVGSREEARADWTGREWQFDIVANKRNGLDVDKLDYLKRDNVACGFLTTADFSALYEAMKVIDGRVCFRTSVRSVVQAVYSARAQMHEFVYTHPVAKAVEYMVVDALRLVAGEIGIPEALHDPERYALLDDTILRTIERSTSQTSTMLAAQDLLRRLRVRDIYKHAGSADIPQDKVETYPKVKPEEILQCQDPASGVQLLPSDVRVHNLKIDYTQHNENPLKHVGFYVNEEDEECVPFAPGNPFAPSTFITRQVRIYLVRLCNSPEEKRQYNEAVKAAFAAWSRKVLQTEMLMSPQKSTLTASARKRQHPGSSQQGGTAPGSRPASAAGTATAPNGIVQAGSALDDDDQPVACSQSHEPAAKKLQF